MNNAAVSGLPRGLRPGLRALNMTDIRRWHMAHVDSTDTDRHGFCLSDLASFCWLWWKTCYLRRQLLMKSQRWRLSVSQFRRFSTLSRRAWNSDVIAVMPSHFLAWWLGTCTVLTKDNNRLALRSACLSSLLHTDYFIHPITGNHSVNSYI